MNRHGWIGGYSLYKFHSSIFDNAQCRDSLSDSSNWDLEISGEDSLYRVRRHRVAKAICNRCPIKVACLEFAEAMYESTLNSDGSMVGITGVWGGRVFAPADYNYPRCTICDHPLATTFKAIRKLSYGYRMPSNIGGADNGNDVCENCATVARPIAV